MKSKSSLPFCAAGVLWLVKHCEATVTVWIEIWERFLKTKQHQNSKSTHFELTNRSLSSISLVTKLCLMVGSWQLLDLVDGGSEQREPGSLNCPTGLIFYRKTCSFSLLGHCFVFVFKQITRLANYIRYNRYSLLLNRVYWCTRQEAVWKRTCSHFC